MKTKTCKQCGVIGKENLFQGRLCIPCFKIKKAKRDQAYYQANKPSILSKQKKYAQSHKEDVNRRNREYKSRHSKRVKEAAKDYRIRNKSKIATKRRETRQKINKWRSDWTKEQRKKDPSFKLRENFSNLIRCGLKASGSSKAGQSILQYLPYSFQELRKHIEGQFEDWMTWKNWGKYDSKPWDDNDKTTWTWQIDHIVPRSALPYKSMKSKNFKKCWALENLRPYSAKKNVLDGNRRTIKVA